jgi:carbonic anhydrase
MAAAAIAVAGNKRFARVKQSPNKSANTDPQQQKAASPRVLWSGCLQRYP